MPNNTIADNLSRLVVAKSDIANAITTMGGTIGENDGLEDYAQDILGIPKGGETVEIYGIPNGWVSVDGFPESVCIKNTFADFVVYCYVVIGQYVASGSSHLTFTFDVDQPYSTYSYGSGESYYTGTSKSWYYNTQFPSTTINNNSVTVTGGWGHVAYEKRIVCLNGFVLLNVWVYLHKEDFKIIVKVICEVIHSIM